MKKIELVNLISNFAIYHSNPLGDSRFKQYDQTNLWNLLGFALGIAVKILFAPFAKRLQRKARSNAQIFFSFPKDILRAFLNKLASHLNTHISILTSQ